MVSGSESADKAWAILEAGARDQSAEKRTEAVSALGIITRNQRAIQAAEHALEDPKSDVRQAAVAALGEMDSKASLGKIKALLGHSDAKTVLTIAAVLTNFNDPQGYEIYYQILTGKRKAGGGILDGLKDRKTLEKMGVEEALGFVPFGSIGVGAYDYFKRNDTANVNVAAASALALDPDPESEKALVGASFGGKEVVQVSALRALAKRGDPAVLKDIEPAMYSGKPLVSYTAAAAVVHLTNRRPRSGAKRNSAKTRP
jgi:HEAT repeat protein